MELCAARKIIKCTFGRGNPKQILYPMMWIQIRTDPHYERPPGSGFAWNMRIRIEEAEIATSHQRCRKLKLKKMIFISRITGTGNYFLKIEIMKSH